MQARGFTGATEQGWEGVGGTSCTGWWAGAEEAWPAAEGVLRPGVGPAGSGESLRRTCARPAAVSPPERGGVQVLTELAAYAWPPLRLVLTSGPCRRRPLRPEQRARLLVARSAPRARSQAPGKCATSPQPPGLCGQLSALPRGPKTPPGGAA